MQKKAQTGQVNAIVIGIAGIIIAFIIAFIAISTLLGSEALLSSVTNTTTNESQGVTGSIVYANGSSAYTVVGFSGATGRNARSFSISDAWVQGANDGTFDDQLNSTYRGYLSIDDNGFLTNTTHINASYYSNLSITYTNLADGIQEGGAKRLSANLTEGADEIAGQIPTLLLIAIIVLVLIILGILVGVWYKMGNRGL